MFQHWLSFHILSHIQIYNGVLIYFFVPILGIISWIFLSIFIEFISNLFDQYLIFLDC